MFYWFENIFVTLKKNFATLSLLITQISHAYCWWCIHWPIISQLAVRKHHHAAGHLEQLQAALHVLRLCYTDFFAQSFMFFCLFTCLYFFFYQSEEGIDLPMPKNHWIVILHLVCVGMSTHTILTLQIFLYTFRTQRSDSWLKSRQHIFIF